MKNLDKYPLESWAKSIYETAVKKGFWEASKNVDTKLMLIICELGEAVEADRKNRRAKFDLFKETYLSKCSTVSRHRREEDYGSGVQPITDQDAKKFIPLFEEYMKDTVEDEIADAFIRMLDLIAYLYSDHGVGLPEIRTFVEEASDMGIKEEFAANCLSLVGPVKHMQLEQFIKWVIQYCEFANINLVRHVELKMLYNTYRDNLHGKLY